MDIALLIVGLILGNNGSFDIRLLGHYFIRSRKIVYEVDFMFMAACSHLYTLMTHIKLLSHGELPVMLAVLSALATTEALCLLRVAYALEAVMEGETVVSRMHMSVKSPSLLAGSSMLCDLRKGGS